jgi:hypothetical protein
LVGTAEDNALDWLLWSVLPGLVPVLIAAYLSWGQGKPAFAGVFGDGSIHVFAFVLVAASFGRMLNSQMLGEPNLMERRVGGILAFGSVLLLVVSMLAFAQAVLAGLEALRSQVPSRSFAGWPTVALGICGIGLALGCEAWARKVT